MKDCRLDALYMVNLSLMAIKQSIKEDLHKKIDIIRIYENIKPLFLEMIDRDLVYA